MTTDECGVNDEAGMTFVLRHSFLFIWSGIFEAQMQRLSCVQPFVELSLQCALCFGGQPVLYRPFPGKLGQDRQFVLEILAGNSVPQSVFERENVYLLLLDTKNFRVWELNNNFPRANID